MNFQLIYTQKLQNILTILENDRKKIVGTIILSRVLQFSLLTLFFSYYFGFIAIFGVGFTDFGNMFSYMKIFFYLVSGIILFTVLRTGIITLSQLFNPALAENKRKINIITAISTVISFFISERIGLLILGESFSLGMFLKWGGGIFLMIILGLLSFMISGSERKFIERVKNEIIPPIIKSVDSNYQFTSKSFVPQSFFVKSELFNTTNLWKYEGGNLITGQLNTCNFEFSQLYVQEKTTTTSGGKTETRTSDIFKGVFYRADFNKDFKGKTIIKPDYPRKIFGTILGEMLNSSVGLGKAKIVKLEDVEFEKEFAVYSTDQVEARYILTTSFMNRLLNLRKKFRHDIYVSFSGNKIFIAIPSAFDLFSPLILKPINTPQQIEPVFELITTFLNIATELHLNQNIWGETNN